MGLNVDSAIARAATKSDEKINIIAMNDCTKMACSGREDLRNNTGRTWLAFDQASCSAGLVKWVFKIGNTGTESVVLHVDSKWIPYLLTCRYWHPGGHSGPFCQR